MFDRRNPERRHMRKSDLAQTVGAWVWGAASTVLLGLIAWFIQDVIQNQRTLIINDEVQKEHQINFEKSSRREHDNQYNEIRSIKKTTINLDKRVTVLENYAN